MAHPPEIAVLAGALGQAGRVAVDVSDDLLDGLAVLGDRTTQDAVDGVVDEAAGLLREVAAACQELTLALAGAVPHAVAGGAGGDVDGVARRAEETTSAETASADAKSAERARPGRPR